MAIRSGRICPTGNLSSSLISVPVDVGKSLLGRGRVENDAMWMDIASAYGGEKIKVNTEKTRRNRGIHIHRISIFHFCGMNFGLEISEVIFSETGFSV